MALAEPFNSENRVVLDHGKNFGFLRRVGVGIAYDDNVSAI